METLGQAAMKKLRQFLPQEITNTAWAFATLSVSNTSLFLEISVKVLPRIGEFDPQGLSNLTWACATVSFHDSALMSALSSESIAKIQHFLPQNLGNTVWALAKMSIQDFQLLHAAAGASLSCILEHKPQEISNTAWALAKLGFKHNPLMDGLASAALKNMDDLNPHDLSGTAWAFATLSYSQTELLQAISKASIQRLSEFNSQDLANTAWSFATCDFESRGEDAGHSDVGAMSSEVMVKLPEFAPQGLATTAWAYSNSKKKDRTLLEAISKEVMQKLYEIEPQSLGILADAKLGCQRHIEQALRPFAQKFAELLPKPTHNETGWVSVDDASLRIFTDFVREVRVDNFGAWGTRHILEQMRLEEPASDFISRAKDAILKAGETEEVGTSREGVLAGAALVHRRVFAYGEYHLEVPGSEPLTGAMARENGRRDRGYDPKYALIRPLASPISGLVDRGLCSEFQILAKLVDTVEDTLTQGQGSQGSQGSQGQDGQVQALPVRAVRDVRGRIQIFVSTSPCVSCLWALRQCQFHLPQVQLGVVNGEEVLAPTLRGLD